MIFKIKKKLTIQQKNKICFLLENCFKDPQHLINIKKYFFRNEEGSHKFIILENKNEIIGFTIMDTRCSQLLGESIKIATLGSVCILDKYRGQGLSYKLMNYIDEEAKRNKIDLIYLQGIDNFYYKFDYYQIMSKSKIIINCKNEKYINNNQVIIEDINIKDIPNLNILYDKFNNLLSINTKREEKFWLELIEYATETWYFYKPKKITINGKIVAYFTTDPSDEKRIREFVYSNEKDNLLIILKYMSNYFLKQKYNDYEIMTWYDSDVYNEVKYNLNGVFIENLKNNGSQLGKIINYEKLISIFNNYLNSYNNDICIKNKFSKLEIYEKNKKITYIELKNFIGVLTGYKSLALQSKKGNRDKLRSLDSILKNNKASFILQTNNL
jgi:N-acetylglutamate synthase-like GNAT family acetyltransferase